MGTIHTRLGGKHHTGIGAGVDSGTAKDGAVHGNRKFSCRIANIGVIVRCSVTTKSYRQLRGTGACHTVIHARWQARQGDISFQCRGIVSVVGITGQADGEGITVFRPFANAITIIQSNQHTNHIYNGRGRGTAGAAVGGAVTIIKGVLHRTLGFVSTVARTVFITDLFGQSGNGSSCCVSGVKVEGQGVGIARGRHSGKGIAAKVHGAS